MSATWTEAANRNREIKATINAMMAVFLHRFIALSPSASYFDSLDKKESHLEMRRVVLMVFSVTKCFCCSESETCLYHYILRFLHGIIQ